MFEHVDALIQLAGVILLPFFLVMVCQKYYLIFFPAVSIEYRNTLVECCSLKKNILTILSLIFGFWSYFLFAHNFTHVRPFTVSELLVF